MATLLYACPYCTEDFTAPSKSLLGHIRLVHSSEPDFNIQCSVQELSKTLEHIKITFFLAILPQVHVAPSLAKKHPLKLYLLWTQILVAAILYRITPRSDNTTTPLQRKHATKWILKVSETWSLTRAGTIGIIEEVSDIVDFMTQSLKDHTHHILSNNCRLDVDCLDGVLAKIDDSFINSVSKPFDGLSTFHQQIQYYKEHFNFIVSLMICLSMATILWTMDHVRRYTHPSKLDQYPHTLNRKLMAVYPYKC